MRNTDSAETSMRHKVLVIGLDGATWSILRPMLSYLPNIRRLVQNGVHGLLRSSIPPRTFPAWKCYSTGKNPGKLGVFDFFKVDIANRRAEVCNSTSFRSKEIWHIMSTHGLKVCIINMPTTFPPSPVNGVLIGGPFSALTGYTYPPEIETQLHESYNYTTFIEQLSFETDWEATFDQALRIIKTRFDVGVQMLKALEPDFMHLTIFLCDMIQHYGTQAELRKAWRFIDNQIGRILNLLDDMWTIFLMSDHGFAEKLVRFNVNVWLKKQGYLTTRKPPLARYLKIEPLYRVIQKMGLLRIIKRFVPRHILRKYGGKVAHTHGKLGPQGVLDSIVWEKTKAFFSGACIFLTKQNDKLKTQLVKELDAITEPRSGRKAFHHVYTREEAYNGKYVQKAPDIIPVANDGIELGTSINGIEFDYSTTGWRRDHALDGIFVISGPEIAQGIKLNTSILDLAPTILHILNLPIPPDIDGEAITRAFDHKSPIQK